MAGDETLNQPLWIYSIGTAICSTRINIADKVGDATLRENSDCFLPDQKNVRALGYYGNADLLFYSDVQEMTITRLRLFDTGVQREKLPITANVASVKGLSSIICIKRKSRTVLDNGQLTTDSYVTFSLFA